MAVAKIICSITNHGLTRMEHSNTPDRLSSNHLERVRQGKCSDILRGVLPVSRGKERSPHATIVGIPGSFGTGQSPPKARPTKAHLQTDSDGSKLSTLGVDGTARTVGT